MAGGLTRTEQKEKAAYTSMQKGDTRYILQIVTISIRSVAGQPQLALTMERKVLTLEVPKALMVIRFPPMPGLKELGSDRKRIEAM